MKPKVKLYYFYKSSTGDVCAMIRGCDWFPGLEFCGIKIGQYRAPEAK